MELDGGDMPSMRQGDPGGKNRMTALPLWAAKLHALTVFPWCVSLCLGVTAGWYLLPKWAWPWFFGLALGGAVVSAVLHFLGRPVAALGMECLGWLCAGVCVCLLAMEKPPALPTFAQVEGGAMVVAQGRVTSCEVRLPDKQRCLLAVESLAQPRAADRFSWQGVLALHTTFGDPNNPLLNPGRAVTVTGRLLYPGGGRNPGEPSWRRQAMMTQTSGRLLARSSVKGVEDRGSGFDAGLALQGLRHRLAVSLMAYADRDTGPLVAALALGDRSYIDDAQWEFLRRSGTAHLVAISGLHLALVALWCYLALTLAARLLLRGKAAQNPRAVAVLPTLAAVTAYSLLTGMSLPTLRALVMVTIYGLALRRGQAGGARYGLYGLAAALLVVVLVWPLSLFSLSLQLSFLAVAVLALMDTGPRADVLDVIHTATPLWLVAWRYLRGLAVASVAAFAVTAPVLVAHGSGPGPAGLWCNLAAVPLVTFAALPLGLLAVCLQAAGLPGVETLVKAMAGLLDVYQWIMAQGSAVVPHLSGRSTAALSACAGGLLVAYLGWRRLPHTPLAATATALAAGLWLMLSPPQAPDHCRLLVFDAGPSLTLLVQRPGKGPVLLGGDSHGAVPRRVEAALTHLDLASVPAITFPDDSFPSLSDDAGLRLLREGPLVGGLAAYRLEVEGRPVRIVRQEQVEKHETPLDRLGMDRTSLTIMSGGLPCQWYRDVADTLILAPPLHRISGTRWCSRDCDATAFIPAIDGAIACQPAGQGWQCESWFPRDAE